MQQFFQLSKLKHWNVFGQQKLTPSRVAIISMIPVIHATVRLTNLISSAAVELGEVFDSSSQRADGWEVKMTLNDDSAIEGVSLQTITPTIWPARVIQSWV